MQLIKKYAAHLERRYYNMAIPNNYWLIKAMRDAKEYDERAKTKEDLKRLLRGEPIEDTKWFDQIHSTNPRHNIVGFRQEYMCTSIINEDVEL